jgi:hypothetical protein
MLEGPQASYLVIRSSAHPGFIQDLEGTTVHSNGTNERTVVLHMLYAGCMLIVLGAVVGIAGSKLVDATTGATLGTAVLGAGAAMLPTGAIAGARSASTAKPEQPTAPEQPSET